MSILSDALFGRSPDKNLLAAKTVNFDPATIAQLFGQAQNYGNQTVQTGDALRESLRQQNAVTGDQMSEQFNMKGQSPQAGVFQDAMARQLGRSNADAQLRQQDLLANTISNYFGEGQSNYLKNAMFNAGQEQNARTAMYTSQAQDRNNRMSTFSNIAGGIAGVAGGPLGQAMMGLLPHQNAPQNSPAGGKTDAGLGMSEQWTPNSNYDTGAGYGNTGTFGGNQGFGPSQYRPRVRPIGSSVAGVGY